MPNTIVIELETIVVDCGWCEWGEWTDCSVDCGGGDKTRKRFGECPEAQFDGEVCLGADEECERCSLDPCPSKCKAEPKPKGKGKSNPKPKGKGNPFENPAEAPAEAPSEAPNRAI